MGRNRLRGETAHFCARTRNEAAMAKRTHRASACKLRPGAFTGTDRQRRFARPVNPLCLYIPFQHIGKRDAIDVGIDRSPHAMPESAGLASLRVVAFPLVIDACNRHA